MRVRALWRQWFPRALDTGDLAEGTIPHLSEE